MNRMTRNRTPIALCLTILLGAMAFGASAQQAAAPAQAPVDTPADAQAQPASDQKQARVDDSHCLRQTGSRIRTTDRTGKADCRNVGRAYDRDQLDRTGRVNLADALRSVDPSIH
ncbi:hypothetical protein QLQ15_09510 [Lysobacter sp. LF1]|uniref:Uncharacterized protein n=1 Tax=Lysobacter stagni TaxID=3045172 RepID=A0ABT6XGH2_9GAMM|nr:hypothetical protein [Lysobacter sp. LF1]MDI9239146.1 hypothetical protein [Lysobacter sp. LF1]